MRLASGRRSRALLAVVAVATLSAGCGGGRKGNEFRMVTDSYNIRVMVDPAPPQALETITWTVVVNDRETGRPIDAGEGRVFASNRDGKNIANGFAPTEQVGMYKTTLMYVTAGTWAMGIQFRRDSTAVLERTQDWMQEVRSANEPGEFTLPSTSPPRLVEDTTARDSVRRDSAIPAARDTTPSGDAVTPR